MEHWKPRTLQECAGDPILGWTTGILAAGMLFWYVRIALRWWDAANSASPEGRKVWHWLVAIFIVCACAGYGSWIVALFWPKTAVISRIFFLALQNFICPMFWWYATDRRFGSVSGHERIGHELENAINSERFTSDQELASLCRDLVKQNLRLLGEKNSG